jgi:hypothetical protein
MGRGRAKAKQTKVARELKYSSHGTDLDALAAELTTHRPEPVQDSQDEDDEDDLYAQYAVEDEDDATDDERQAR